MTVGYCDDVHVGLGCYGIAKLVSVGILAYIEACLKSLITVKYHIFNFAYYSCNLSCLKLYKFYVVRLINDVVYGSGKSYAILKSKDSVVL